MSTVGTVDSLWRYPVKSMGGEELEEAFAGFSGVYGDRYFAFRSPASPRGFPYLTGREQEQMLRYRPRFRYPDKAAQPPNLAAAERIAPGINPVNADPADMSVDVLTPSGTTLAVDDPGLTSMLNGLGMSLEEHEQPYVLAVSGRAYAWAGFCQHRVGVVLDCLRQGELLSEESWKRISAREGSKGPRLYDWTRLPLNPPMQEGFERWLLVRRSIEDPEELTAYTVFAPEGAELGELARAAGSRWRVEIGFKEAKGEVGLVHYEVRSWHGWYRHVTLALFAHAFLATIRAEGQDIETPQKGGSKPAATNSLSAFKRGRGLSWN